MKTTKKLLAILMAAAMVLCLLACGNEPAEQTGSQDGEALSDPRVYGMLVFSTDASVSINYDSEGLVLGLEGNNAEGIVLVENYEDYLGKSCSDVVTELMNKSAEYATVTQNVIVKQSYGSALPGTNFLENIVSEAQAAADAADVITNVIMITAEDLDENGYISLEMAKTIVLSKLGLESAATFDGDPSPDTNGDYMFYLEEGDVKGTFLLNAITGIVQELSEEDLRLLEGEYGEEEIPTEETNFDNLPAESSASEAETTTGAQEETPVEDTTAAGDAEVQEP